jgi:thioredoxin-like negative regulator of GroEL
MKATSAWRGVADELDGEFEVGAINAETNTALKKRFEIRQFPQIFLFSAEWKVRMEYNWKGIEQLSGISAWARQTVQDWDALFTTTQVKWLNAESFKSDLLE